jgi:hypothetical protein
MKTKSIQQEILLLTGTKFSAREWAEKKAGDKNTLSPIEKLEDACWNGLLYEMLPGIVKKTADGKKLTLWQIHQCQSFLGIEMSDSTPVIKPEFSIDPYLFSTCLYLS